MNQRSPYDYTNEELLDAVLRAAANLGASESGLCIDVAAPAHQGRLRYLRGVLLARLEGAQPPFRPGEVVRLREESATGLNRWQFPSEMWGRKPSTILRVLYEGRRGGVDRWTLIFEKIKNPPSGCPAEHFEKIQADITPTP